MKITKTLSKEKFDKMFFDKEIPDQFLLNGKEFNTRFWIDDCRFLFVKNDEDGLIYSYIQADVSKPAVLITKATEEKALNVFKGAQKFVVSINMNSRTQELKNSLFEMQNQLDFMKTFANSVKIATNTTKAKTQEEYAKNVNLLIGEGMKMDKVLNDKKQELEIQRDALVEKVASLQAQLEDEKSFVEFMQGEHDKEIAELLAEATLYIEQKDNLAEDLTQAYANYQALGVDYEALEKEKKDLQSENKWLGKQLRYFEKEFLRMKSSNSRNRQSFEFALDEIAKLQKRLDKTQSKSQNTISSLRKERNMASDRISALTAELKKSGNEYSKLKTNSDKEIENLLNEYMLLEQKQQKSDKELLEVLDAYMLLEEESAAIKAESAAIKFKKAEEVAADINENEAKVYRLTSDKDGEIRPVFLAVGPHYNELMRKEGKKGRAYETLYVIIDGDPTSQLDADGNIIPVEKLLIDENYRKTLNIHGVSKIDVDKNQCAKIRYYDSKNNAKVATAKYSKEAKDVDRSDLNSWIQRNYGYGKVRLVAPTFKVSAALKLAGVVAGAVLLAGSSTFGGFKAWGGPNEIDQAKETGKKQISAFVDGLEADQSLFQYEPAVDAYGSRIKYLKLSSGEEIAVEGNKISAIGSANRVFYNEAENKLVINEHKQENFWGKLKTYKEETIEGAAYQLGAEVVEELSKNNVPVYSLNARSTAKQPLYVYLNFAAENSDYSSRNAMISYLKNNGYNAELADQITTAYEQGFVSGLENGLSNKVEEMIGSNDVVTPEIPAVSFVEASTKTAIANKVAETTLQGKKYSADELHVVYSDLGADGEQVLFVMANKDGATGANANKYLYKIILGDGSSAIDSTNIDQAIENATDVTESSRLDFVFKDSSKYGAAVENFYNKTEEGSIAYISNYGLSQNGDSFEVTPTLTIYNAQTGVVTEENAKYTVSVAAGEKASVTEMCAVALLGDYGYFDSKGIYSALPVEEASIVSKSYSDNEKELG